MNIISGVYWDKGKRLSNQDSLILEQVLTKRGRVVLAAVCDGIAGLAEGENASGFVCEKLKKCFYRELLPMLVKGRSRRAVKKCFYRCLYDSSEGLRKYADSKGIGLGTTISLLLIWRKQYLTVHLGDGRIYKLKGTRIQQLTTDHRREHNILTKCLGSFGYRLPDVQSGRVSGGMGFLLCTDGFYHTLNNRILAEAFQPKEVVDVKAIERRLKELAIYGQKKGEQDNITAVYLLCRKGKSEKGGK